ncbi:Nif3-like dinuclear metal center hexameric protein [Mariniphaga sp.]|uniref:Nif3-like dinuclear metal center hexameric protein n=1 Tax=Mariniphaga sp. TaxID=1954475 RepID=UPI00356237BE
MKTKFYIVLFLLLPFISIGQITAEDIVNRIKKQVTCPWADQTVDAFKAGNPKSELTGIAVCMFADMQVLKEAVEKGCNFIITHEPVFYNHLDQTESFQNDPVFLEKKEFIEKNGLVIFRFHDHIHKTEPDGISVGMIQKLELNRFAVNGSQTFFQVPEKTLKDYANELKQKFNMENIRVIGNSELKFTKLAFMAGAPGGQRHIQMLRNDDVEVIIAGEAPEWETYLYANDAVQQDKNKAVIFLGHIKSEEAGMEYCAEWLREFVVEVPIHFIENKPNFITF